MKSKCGEERTRRVFLWLPVQANVKYKSEVNGFPCTKKKQETRWLVFANVKEVFLGGVKFRGSCWVITEFLD